MPRHSESKFLPYTPDQLFDLVADVARYDEFLPWVVAVRIRSSSETETVADLVVGFNVISFDYAVLQAYTDEDLSGIRTLDMLVEVTKALGHRLKLDSLAAATLNSPKSADGLQAVKWWREGNLVDLLAYCQKDVEITRDLWEFGRKHGYLLYQDKNAGLLKVPVSW